MRTGRWTVIAAVVLALAACTSKAPTPKANPVQQVAWRSVSLPADPRGRETIRAVAACAGRWYVAGAIIRVNGTTVPAAWTSSDGATFTPMTVKPVSFYGQANTLFDVACRNGDVVAVGSMSGGAHGNPRTSTWRSTAGGPLVEKPSGLELYGGGNAIGVGAATAGKPGYLIVGARIDQSGGAGAAVWTSPDGAEFTLRDGVPALESDQNGRTEIDAGAPVDGGFIGVGGITPPHSPLAARDPIAWTSADGASWKRLTFPHTGDDDLLLSVAQHGTGILAVGTGNQRFTAWSADATGAGWRRTAQFGAIATGSTAVPAVPSIVTAASGATYVVVSTAAEYQLWRGTGASWERVALPETVSAEPVRSGPRVVCATAAGDRLMVATDDGTQARLLFTAI